MYGSDYLGNMLCPRHVWEHKPCGNKPQPSTLPGTKDDKPSPVSDTPPPPPSPAPLTTTTQLNHHPTNNSSNSNSNNSNNEDEDDEDDDQYHHHPLLSLDGRYRHPHPPTLPNHS